MKPNFSQSGCGIGFFSIAVSGCGRIRVFHGFLWKSRIRGESGLNSDEENGKLLEKGKTEENGREGAREGLTELQSSETVAVAYTKAISACSQ
ncbi:hypothetical protein K1719_036911 [Acacia pycnantha]|nr:hypothetical protein K1719_036911 [Acacia pycnantha]